MNLIVLSHMYPNDTMPYAGTFVREQVAALRRHVDGSIHVVSPIPYAPRAVWFKDKWRRYGTMQRDTLEDGVRVIRPRYVCPPRNRLMFITCSMYVTAVRAVAGLLKVTGARDTILHSHALLPDGLAGAMAARRLGIKSVCTLHGSDINVYPNVSRPIYELSKLGMGMNHSMVAVSDVIKNRALKIRADRRIDVITNGVDAGKFSPGEHPGEYGGKGARRILYVGRLIEQKGIRELLEAFRRIRLRYPDSKLVMVGEPDMRGWIESFALENGLGGSVEMPGAVPHEELPRYYREADVFVLPSYSEGMPVVMFEAMASRLPVVVTDVGGVPEVVKDGVNGLIIRPRLAGDIAEKVSLLFDDAALAKRLAHAGYDDAVTKYTWDASARLLAGKYKEMLG